MRGRILTEGQRIDGRGVMWDTLAIAETLLAKTGNSLSIAIYLIIVCVISLIGVSLVKETKGNPLGVPKHH